MSYKFISDPGHGWMEVPTLEVVKMGLKISSCSYVHPSGKYMYLEEDCDLQAFLFAKVRQDGNVANSSEPEAEPEVRKWLETWWKANVVDVYEESPDFRNYPRVKKGAA